VSTSGSDDPANHWWNVNPAGTGDQVFRKVRVAGKGNSTEFCAGATNDDGSFDSSSVHCEAVP
jgi:hypothetical protein